MTILMGKTALVTGANRGIGRAIFERLLRLGVKVVGVCRDAEGREELQEYLKYQNEGQGFSYLLDVSQVEEVELFFKQLPTELKNIDILVNNAGICRDNLVMRMGIEEWEQVLATDLSAIFYLTRQVLRQMLKQRWGRIINLSSVVAFVGNAGQANYASAKAGLIGFSKSLAQEVASRNVTVNCIAPGYIESTMTMQLSIEQRESILARIPMKRAGTVEEVASVVEFLVGEGSSYITGSVIHLNGGMLML